MRTFILMVFPVLSAFFWQPDNVAISREVAFTFDDLPCTHGHAPYIIQNITEKLVAHNVPAIGFVNEGKLYRDGIRDTATIALLDQWLDSNLDLGNHTYSHIGIDAVSLEVYESDILKGEKVTKELLSQRGKKLRYYRHPLLRTGPTLAIKKELEAFLKQHNYTVAPVTIDNNEYIFANLYEKAKRKNDTALMNYVSAEYIKYMETVVKHFEKISLDFLGYEVKQILLLHANTLNADHLDALIALFKKRNYSFITIDDALKDPAYRLEEAPSKKGLSWLHRWMLAKGQDIIPEPVEPDSIAHLNQNY